MAPPIKTSRERWIQEGLTALADGGVDKVRVEVLAERIGVSKGGFYGHFENRDALLEALLDAWEQALVEEVIVLLDDTGDARARLTRLFDMAASNSDWLRVDLAVRDWARGDRAVAVRLARVDDRRMDYLRSQFRQITDDAVDAEARALLVAALWVGAHPFAAGHGNLRREDVAQAALDRLLA